MPYTRGEEVSRPFDDVLIEVADLADQGVKEVTLLGQNVNAYRGRMTDSDEIADFAMLLEYVHEIPGIERIRYTTSVSYTHLLPDLEFTESEENGKLLLLGALNPAAVTRVQDSALKQNINTLHNRINELGVAEPVIQQQGCLLYTSRCV